MFCCSNCFTDVEIRAIIEGKKRKGHCDFCGSHNVFVYDTDKDNTLSELFDGLLDIYTPISFLEPDFPEEKTELLKNLLCESWQIFNLEPEKVNSLIKSICTERYIVQPELFDTPVGIKQAQDADYLEENSILKNYHWNEFVEGIKHKNRFHSNYLNMDKLLIFLRCAAKKHRKDMIMYRSRICPNDKGFKGRDMSAPPVNLAKSGRVNPEGISFLYLSDSKDTTYYEIRAGIFDFVTVGSFKLLKDIEVINLANIEKISPFIGIDYGFDFTQYAVNIEHLKLIASEIAKPLRNDNVLDYLPTQFISDFIHSKGYDGIEYTSTMHKNGTNLAVFDPSLFKCIKTQVYDITSITYDSVRL